jgi:hypothetical protein
LTEVETGPRIREIEFLFRDLVKSAQNLIVMEGQYYWSREVNDLLIAKLSMIDSSVSGPPTSQGARFAWIPKSP